ncbi:MAG: hypothetical protein HOV81_34600 [Kofleriaceae bacterium]|nr:hypothetical protein [Kofleriaceae bacterium]
MPSRSSDERRYLEVQRRLAPVTQWGALAICVMIVGSTWGDWRRFTIAVVLHAILFPLNVMCDRVVVPWLGRRAEVVRVFVNGVVSVIGYQMIGWPVPVWFWLPFNALTFEQFATKTWVSALVAMCAIQDVAAIICGVSALYPIAFTAVALIAYKIGDARLAIIRDMFVEAEEQRDELERAHRDLQIQVEARERAEIELRQAQKLEAIGRLASGVAHEINTPMQFIGDNLQFVTDGVTELLQLANAAPPEAAEAADLPYLQDNMPTALEHAADGVRRVAAIVRSMKQFAHSGEASVSSLDMNETIANTLVIAAHEYKLVAQVETHYGALRPVECRGGEIAQVLLNLIVNAAHAIADRVGTSKERGRITITSSLVDNDVVVAVTDTGGGIPEEIRDRIFEPFFTTKEVGRGTGQGLAISRAVIERHGGKLSFTSELGVGTTFEMRLPATRVRLSTGDIVAPLSSAA